ncbi:MAG: nucleotidyl transferase AbiEii/AbiGii toxin family protein [Solirubrobacteraceae bacterium]
MIPKGPITKRAQAEGLPAQTIERDYILAHICARIGETHNSRLVFKGGTLLRLCYFDEYRYSADLDFSAIDGLTCADALAILAHAVDLTRQEVELPALQLEDPEGGAAWISYVGPLGGKPRKIKLDISDDELVESHRRLDLQRRWPDLPDGTSIEGYGLDEVGAEKLRCIAERVQCRDLHDIHELLAGGHIDPLEAWYLYLRKSDNDVARGRQRTPPREWSLTFERRMALYKERWLDELSDYLTTEVPPFRDVDRRARSHLSDVLAAARELAGSS